MKQYAIATSKEAGESGQFVAGPFPTLLEAATEMQDDSQELFSVDENGKPKWLDVKSGDTISF